LSAESLEGKTPEPAQRAQLRWCRGRALLGMRRQPEAVDVLLEIVHDPDSPKQVARLAEAELDALNVMFRFPPWARRAGDPPWAMFFPQDANYVGDPVPFVDGEKFHIFHMFMRPGIRGASQFHIATTDFLAYEDLGIAIPNTNERGGIDQGVATGSVIVRNGTYHFFYCGTNGEFRAKGKPGQMIRQAVSKDLKSWTKLEDFVLTPDASKGYHPTESWRDPFVFWNDGQKQYWMLITADSGDPSKHMWNSGLIGLAVSNDLYHWEIREPFLSPGKYMNYECPNLFHWGEWFYLVFSPDMSPNRKETKYIMSRSLSGPWITPDDDVLDGRAFYAGAIANKSEQEHYIIGWVSRRDRNLDSGHWKWGGQLVAHRLVQRPDGTLGARMIDSVRVAFTRELALAPERIAGEWSITGKTYASRATSRRPNTAPAPLKDRSRSLLRLGTLPERCLFEMTVTMSSNTGTAGLLLGGDPRLDTGLEVRLEGFRKSLRLTNAPDQYRVNQELERPLSFKPGAPVRVAGLIDNNCLTIYVDDNVALSGRVYDRRDNAFGVFVQDTEAEFSKISFKAVR
jgi:beta-fructofuranosidase